MFGEYEPPRNTNWFDIVPWILSAVLLDFNCLRTSVMKYRDALPERRAPSLRLSEGEERLMAERTSIRAPETICVGGAWYDRRDTVARERLIALADECIANREKVAAMMTRVSIATGHGDTIDALLIELEGAIVEMQVKMKNAYEAVNRQRCIKCGSLS